MLTFQTLISNLGGLTYMLPFCILVALFLFVLRERKDALLVLLTSGIAMAITYAIKYSFKIPRPSDMLISGDLYRFPSGHATFAAVVMSLGIYFTSEYTRKPTLQYLLYILAVTWYLFMSYSRIYLHAHLLVDVLVGGVIGVLVTVLLVRYKKHF